MSNNMNNSNVNVSMGPVQDNSLPPDNSMMQPNGMMMTPGKDQAYSIFLWGVCCETACHLIWPIVYGLYLFEAIGK